MCRSLLKYINSSEEPWFLGNIWILTDIKAHSAQKAIKFVRKAWLKLFVLTCQFSSCNQSLQSATHPDWMSCYLSACLSCWQLLWEKGSEVRRGKTHVLGRHSHIRLLCLLWETQSGFNTVWGTELIQTMNFTNILQRHVCIVVLESFSISILKLPLSIASKLAFQDCA